MFCVSFAGFLKIIASGVGFSAIFLPQGSEFRTFLCACGVKNSPFQKYSPGGCPEGVLVSPGID